MKSFFVIGCMGYWEVWMEEIHFCGNWKFMQLFVHVFIRNSAEPYNIRIYKVNVQWTVMVSQKFKHKVKFRSRQNSEVSLILLFGQKTRQWKVCLIEDNKTLAWNQEECSVLFLFWPTSWNISLAWLGIG